MKRVQRTPSAYVLFFKDYYKHVKAKNPHADFAEMGRIMGDIWKNRLDPVEKQEYIHRAYVLRQ